jgi:hypothetical protein
VQTEALRVLAADAAARAWALAVGARTKPLDASVGEDVARRAAAMLDVPEDPGATAAGAGMAPLARRAGLPSRVLLRRALAWRHGGPAGLDVLDHAWDPPAERLAPGRALLGGSVVARRNRVTAGDRQLRLGRDGRWYPFRRARGGWDPDGPALEP